MISLPSALLMTVCFSFASLISARVTGSDTKLPVSESVCESLLKCLSGALLSRSASIFWEKKTEYYLPIYHTM